MEEASYADPDKTICEIALTEDRGCRFQTFHGEAGLQNALDMLTGTAVLCSYTDPDTHCWADEHCAL